MRKIAFYVSLSSFVFLPSLSSATTLNLLNETENILQNSGGALGNFGTNGFPSDAPQLGDARLNPAPELFNAFVATFTIPNNNLRYGGWFIQTGPFGDTSVRDMSSYANGTLRFWIKSTLDARIALTSIDPANQADRREKTYTLTQLGIPFDGQWQAVTIPIVRFTSPTGGTGTPVNLVHMKNLFVLTIRGFTNGPKAVLVDNIRWDTVQPGSLSRITVHPALPAAEWNAVSRGLSVPFVAEGFDSSNNPIDIWPTWSPAASFAEATGNQALFKTNDSTALGPVQVSASTGVFSGAWTIAVQNPPTPLPQVFGVLSETSPGLILDQNSKVLEIESAGATTELSSSSDAPEGGESLKTHFAVTDPVGFSGFYVQSGTDPDNPTTVNMSHLASGTLRFWVRTPRDLEIGLRSSDVPAGRETKVSLSLLGVPADNQWHGVAIPISRLSNRFYGGSGTTDLSKVLALFIADTLGNSNGDFLIDNVRWDLRRPGPLSQIQINALTELDPGDQLKSNQFATFEARGFDSLGVPVDAYPLWSVNPPNTLSSLSGTKVVLRPGATGTATLTASLSGATGNKNVTVVSTQAPELFGVYSDSLAGAILGGPDQNAQLGIASQTGEITDLQDDFTDKREGPNGLSAVLNVQNVPGAFASLFFQWGVPQVPDPDPARPTVNLSQFQGGFLKFWVKTQTDAFLGITSPDVSPASATKIRLSDLGVPADNQWHPVTVPIHSFSSPLFGGTGNIDLTRVQNMFVLTKNDQASGATIKIDNVRWDIQGTSALARITLTPATLTTVPNLPHIFLAQGFDTGDRPMDIEPTWTLTGPIGSLTTTTGPTTVFNSSQTGSGSLRAAVGGISAQTPITVNSEGQAAVFRVFADGTPAGDIGTFPPGSNQITLAVAELENKTFLQAHLTAPAGSEDIPGWFIDVGQVGENETRNMSYYANGTLSFLIRSSQALSFNVSLRSLNIPETQAAPTQRITVPANQTQRIVLSMADFTPSVPGGVPVDFSQIQTFFSIAPTQAVGTLDFHVADVVWITTDPTAPSETKILAALKDKQQSSGLLRSFGATDNRAFTYDQALAAISFLLAGDIPEAQRVFDAYQTLYQTPFHGFANAYDAVNKNVVPGEAGRVAGPNAWMLTALSRYQESTHDTRYQTMTQGLADWLSSLEDMESGGLYFDEAKDRKSTENNLSAIAAITSFVEFAGGAESYRDVASRTITWLAGEMYITAENRFKVGTTVPSVDKALDTYSWGISTFAQFPDDVLADLGIDPKEMARNAERDFVNTQTSVLTGRSVTGFDFGSISSPDKDAVWLEGTGQMVGAYQTLGETLPAEIYIQEIEKALVPLDATKQGIPYATNPGTAYGGGIMDAQNPAVSSMAWYQYALRRFNPFGIAPLIPARPPRVDRVTPSSGSYLGGTTITIAGASFQPNAGVQVGGRPATSVVVNSTISITAVTPPGLRGPANVVVSNTDGQSGTLNDGFVYIATSPVTLMGAWKASWFSTTELANPAIVGPGANPDNDKTVNIGEYAFDTNPKKDDPQPIAIRIRNVAGSNYLALSYPRIKTATDIDYVVVAATSVVGPWYTDAAHVQQILPSVDQGATLLETFRLAWPVTAPPQGFLQMRIVDLSAQPSLAGIEPASAPVEGGTLVSLHGDQFTEGAKVLIGGKEAQAVGFFDKNLLVARVPEGTVGPKDVVVQNPGGQIAKLAGGFLYASSVPFTNFVDWREGHFTEAELENSEISGPNADPDGDLSTNVREYAFGTDPKAAGQEPKTSSLYTDPAGGARYLALTFPRIKEVEDIRYVVVGATEVAGPYSPELVSPDPVRVLDQGSTELATYRLNFPITASPRGFLNVRIEFLNAGPEVLTANPNVVYETGGTTVTVTGRGFAEGAYVTLKSTSTPESAILATHFNSPTQLTALTEELEPGGYDLFVTNPDGRKDILEGGFYILPSTPPVFEPPEFSPEITRLTPAFGSHEQEVVISGAFFTTQRGSVTVEGISAEILSWATSSIRIKIPDGTYSDDVNNVVVHTAKGFSRGVPFGVLDGPPNIQDVVISSRPCAAGVSFCGQPFIVIIRGEDFSPGAMVELKHANQTPIKASQVTISTSTAIERPVFDLSNAAPGDWDIVVTNPDGLSDIWEEAFTVLSTTPTLSEGPIHQVVDRAGGKIVFKANEDVPGVFGGEEAEVRIEIPADGLSTSTEMLVESLREIPSDSDDRLDGTGFGFRISSDGSGRLTDKIRIVYRELAILTNSSSPGVPQTGPRYVIARYDPATGKWIELNTQNTPEGLVATTDQLGDFQIMIAPAAGLNPLAAGVNAAPNPFRPSQGHTQVDLGNLEPNGSVKMYTLTGELVWEDVATPAGTAVWLGKNKSGESVASGVYFIHSGNRTFKLAVQR